METSKLGWTIQQLYEGCLLASIAHAIMVAKYPDLSYEHSWDGFNYSVQDGAGKRGTVSFSQGMCFGAFREDKLIDEAINYEPLLQKLDLNLRKLAYEETLQYLLDDEGGQIKPVITTMFWADNSSIVLSPHDYSEMFIKGGQLLEKQIMTPSQSAKAWQDYYDMSDDQVELMLNLFKRKLLNPNEPITLTSQEISFLGDDEEGLEESRTSFHELNIQWNS